MIKIKDCVVYFCVFAQSEPVELQPLWEADGDSEQVSSFFISQSLKKYSADKQQVGKTKCCFSLEVIKCGIFLLSHFHCCRCCDYSRGASDPPHNYLHLFIPPRYHFSLGRISLKQWDQLFAGECIIHEHHGLLHFEESVWTKSKMQGQFFCWPDKEKSKQPRSICQIQTFGAKSSRYLLESVRRLDFGTFCYFKYVKLTWLNTGELKKNRKLWSIKHYYCLVQHSCVF